MKNETEFVASTALQPPASAADMTDKHTGLFFFFCLFNQRKVKRSKIWQFSCATITQSMFSLVASCATFVLVFSQNLETFQLALGGFFSKSRRSVSAHAQEASRPCQVANSIGSRQLRFRSGVEKRPAALAGKLLHW